MAAARCPLWEEARGCAVPDVAGSRQFLTAEPRQDTTEPISQVYGTSLKTYCKKKRAEKTQRERKREQRARNKRGNIKVRERRRRLSRAEQIFPAACREEHTRADGDS